MLNDDDIQRALVITAHPDDVDFGAAGTVATWTDSGVKVAYCVVTDGDAGGFDANVPRERIGPIRREEQPAGAPAGGGSDRSDVRSNARQPPRWACRTCTFSGIPTAGSWSASTSGGTSRGLSG